jgi:hypothetical protein
VLYSTTMSIVLHLSMTSSDLLPQSWYCLLQHETTRLTMRWHWSTPCRAV